MTKHIEMIIDYITNDSDFQYCDNHGILTRCRDCKKWFSGDQGFPARCTKFNIYGSEHGYCAWAERRTDAAD